MHLTPRRLFLILIAACLCLPLVGCGGAGKSIVRGRVVAGTVGQAVAVSPEDERLKEEGLPLMEVVVMSKGGSASQGRGVYARATSDELGDFELVFPGGTFPSDVVTIQVKGEDVFSRISLIAEAARPGADYAEPAARPAHDAHARMQHAPAPQEAPRPRAPRADDIRSAAAEATARLERFRNRAGGAAA